MKIIVEGEHQISDESGLSVTAKPGDVFLFEKGATITFHYARLYMGWRFIVDSGRRMVLRFISWIK